MKEKDDFKNKEINQLWDHFNEIIKDQSTLYYHKNIEELYKFINSYKLRYQKLKELDIQDLNSYSHLRIFNTSILELLTKSQDAIINYNHQTIIGAYHLQLESLIRGKTKYLRRKELFDGYTINNKTNIPLFVKKLSVNFSLSASRKKKKFYNIFRRIFKKTPLELQTYRQRRVPFRSLIQHHLGSEFDKLMQEVIEELMLTKSQVLLAVWEFDEALEARLQNSLKNGETQNSSQIINQEAFDNLFTSLNEKITTLKAKMDDDIDKIILDVFKQLDEAILIVDTPDLPTSKFRPSIIKLEQKIIIEEQNNNLQKWENTHKTLLDDWTVDVEIVLLYVSVLDDFSGLHSKINDYINENLSFNLELLREFINNSKENIINRSSTAKELKQILIEERGRNSSEFIEKLLAKTINKLSGNINTELEQFNSKTMNLVAQVSDRRGFVKNKNYKTGIKSSEINWLSLRDLLNFEALPHFKASVEEVKDFVDKHLERSRVKLIALGTVSDFSLESAQMMLENKKNAIKGSVQVVIDGYGRALVHLDEASELMDKIKVEPLENLQIAINNFNTEIKKLNSTDNILELNVKIVKIRAIERSKRMRKEALDWIVNFGPKSIGFLKEQFVNTNTYITEIKKKLGILNDKPHISHELSDFLRKTEQSLKKLPFVYQRLYQLTPTNEDRFFVGREKELDALKMAYTSWQKGRFITTAFIGEKGSGITSLILYSLKQIEADIPIINQEISNKIYEPDAYYQFFAELLNQKSFSSNDEIIQHINGIKNQQIIILENLQHLFLKKVKGFGCQKMIFDLMTSTSKKIFWIGSYTSHSWEYLDKTLNISSVFINEIHLEKLTEATIETIIFKRNYLSGYKVDFEPSDSILSSKSYLKLDAARKQEFLKKSFFKDLTQMSNGNVSLAQLYWLRSTYGISDDTIKIMSLRDFDVSFDKDLPSSYFFALHAILIHDGLVIKDYAQAFKSPEYICRNDLVPMLEKGLLMKPKEKYNINPIIFRQVVDLLRSHNFIN